MRRVILAVLLGVVPGSAYAATLNVSMSGSDSGACGAASAPCRTISQAIANAAAGDTVLVDSGRYGDLNQDGDLTDPGEESSGVVGKLIVINKAITIVSRNGAGATTIENSSIANTTSVAIDSSGVVFGKKRKGFTIHGGALNSTGLAVDSAAATVSIAGNVVHTHATSLVTIDGTTHRITNNVFGQGTVTLGGSGHLFKDNVGEGAAVATSASSSLITIDRNQFVRAPSGAGFFIQGSGHVVRRNLASANNGGFVCSGTCTGLQLLDNVARLNSSHGFNLVAGSGHKLSGNLAAANLGNGFNFSFAVPAGVTFTKNTASGNGTFGVDCGGASDAMNHVVITNSAMIGNGYAGIRVTGGGFASVTKSSIYGNDDSGGTNCGLSKIPGGPTIVFAQSNFWGAATGPGVDPADALCGSVATIDATLPLANEVKVAVQKLP